MKIQDYQYYPNYLCISLKTKTVSLLQGVSKTILIPEYNYFLFIKAVSLKRVAFHFMGENLWWKSRTIVLPLRAHQSYLWSLYECWIAFHRFVLK